MTYSAQAGSALRGDRSTLVVGDRSYELDGDVDELKARILEAVRSGGDWVTVVTALGRVATPAIERSPII